MTRVLLNPGDDPKQALRMRRYFLAAGTSLLAIGLLFACYVQGVLPADAFFKSATLVLLAAAVFYAVFRSGLNRNMKDPSLTLPQMTAATLVVLYAMYSANEGRGVILILLLMIFLFSVLRLPARAMLFYALFILAAYAAVIGLLWRFRPQALHPRLEILQWLALALTLPWFALMGGYISELRRRLSKSNAELQSTLQTARTSEASLAEAQRIAQLGSWSFDPVSRVAMWSPETYRIFGIDSSRPAPVGEDFLRIVHPEDSAHYNELIRPALREGCGFDSRFRIVRSDGEVRRVHALGQPALDSNGQTTLLRGTVMDVTERQQLEQRQAMEHAVTRLLAESESVSEAMPKIIQTVCETLNWDCGARWRWNENEQVLSSAETWSVESDEVKEYVAQCAGQSLAPGKAGLVRRVWAFGEPIWIADVSREPGFLRAPMAMKAGLHGAFAFPIQAGGELHGVMEFYIRDVCKPDPALLRVARSIGFQIGQFVARKTAEEQIRRLAHFDPLTGLANRGLFNQVLAHGLTKAERSGRSLAVLFIDLDGFKQINDTLGHDAGDSLLAAFAQRLRDCLRKSDAIARVNSPDTAARLGGDEFVVLIEDFADPSGLAIVAQRILSAAALPFALDGQEGKVTASVGISVYPRDGRDVDSLTKCADSAMYCAKQSGKNNYRFFAAIGQPA